MGLIAIKKAGADGLALPFLDLAVAKFNGSAGLAGVLDPTKGVYYGLTPDNGAKTEDVEGLLKSVADKDVICWFGEQQAHKDSVQPFVLFDEGDGKDYKVHLACFVEGALDHYKEADDARSPNFHFAQKKLFTMINPIWEKHNGDVAKVMAELDNPFVQEAIKGMASGDINVVFLSSTAQIMRISKPEREHNTFSWGWVSDSLGYFEGKAAAAEEEPKTTFGFGNNAEIKRKPAAPAGDGLYYIDKAKPAADTGEVKRKPTAPAGTGPQPVIGDTRKVAPEAPKTSTAIGSTGKKRVRIAPPKTGSDANNKYYHTFYRIYLGNDKDKWAEHFTDGQKDWKKGPSIIVDEDRVRDEHKNLVTELSGKDKLASHPLAPKVEETKKEAAPAPVLPDATPKVKMPEAPIVPAEEIRNVEEQITSQVFKEITDRAGEALKKPDEWMKAQERHALYTDLVGLSSVWDTVPYDFEALKLLGSTSPSMLATLCMQWRLEAIGLKGNAILAAPATKPEPAKKEEPKKAAAAASPAVDTGIRRRPAA